MIDWRIEDDGGPEVVYIEDAPDGTQVSPQALWFRVGPVYVNGKEQSAPGIWIMYQEAHYTTPMMGPVLLSSQAWREINLAVEERLRRWKRKEGKRWWKRR